MGEQILRKCKNSSGNHSHNVFFSVLKLFESAACRQSGPWCASSPFYTWLPADFFRLNADRKCSGHIIGYRFVVWLTDERVAIGFNTSPNSGRSANQKVDGMARILIFDLHGTLKASKDVPYLADGNGEIVADSAA